MSEEDEKYQKFKSNFVSKFKGTESSKLRFFLTDYIELSEISKVGVSEMKLLNVLDNIHITSSSQLTLFSEIAELTKKWYAKEDITNYLKKSGVPVTESTGVKPYRKPFYNAVVNFDPRQLQDVVAFYKLEHDTTITNLWDVIFQLDIDKRLDTRGKLNQLARLLNGVAMSTLTDGLKVLFLKKQDGSISLGPDSKDQLVDLVEKPAPEEDQPDGHVTSSKTPMVGKVNRKQTYNRSRKDCFFWGFRIFIFACGILLIICVVLALTLDEIFEKIISGVAACIALFTGLAALWKWNDRNNNNQEIKKPEHMATTRTL